jgi:hypothetical protein
MRLPSDGFNAEPFMNHTGKGESPPLIAKEIAKRASTPAVRITEEDVRSFLKGRGTDTASSVSAILSLLKRKHGR